MTTDATAPILVVDDNPATRYSTGRILRSVGHAVSSAASGVEAIAMATQSPPALIVLDINLPDIDGFQVCREIRAYPHLRRVPVIYLSATFVDDLDKVHGVNAGADGYLTHPVEPPVLVATVQALLRARTAEEAVQESEARFKAVFDNALNGIALLSDDMILLDANPAMCHILGRERDDVVGKHISVFSSKEQPIDTPEMTAALESEGQWRGHAPILDAAGGYVQLEWSVSLHTVPDIRLAVVSDVTDRRALEAEREQLLEREQRARAEAEEANRIKDEFLASLSHELRTPLNAIVGFSRLLHSMPAVAGLPDVRHAITAIERNAWVQAQLISDLLDISRITSGKLELEREPLSPAEAVAAALASVQSMARTKKVAIRAQLDRDVEPILWDPSRFQQVVWNLVDNAVKFSDTGGVVDVRLQQRSEGVELEIRDYGRGISAEFLPHVFDRFRQEDATSRRGHGGLGLGLAIVHQLVTAHGGTITATSDGEGFGAAFLVRLPRVSLPEPLAPDAGGPAAWPDLRGVRILVVEDNVDARVLMRGVLSDASARVLDVASVEAAIAAIDGFAPDVLVSDLAMPDKDGFDLIRRLRASGWTAERLPAIALSAFARESDRRRALQAGFQAHISKPPDVGTLLRTIASLARDRGLPPSVP